MRMMLIHQKSMNSMILLVYGLVISIACLDSNVMRVHFMMIHFMTEHITL